jgi:SPP1 gp7 family putative phage head morphogenesis protein
VFRTQTLLAYGAGKQDFENSPDVRDILWGYKYVTVGDDRVRPAHAAMEGTTSPKDDPFWARNNPPNGWACRCTAIPLYEPADTWKPPDRVVIDGQEVTPGADRGFQFSPSRLFRSLPGVAVPA